MPRLFEHFVTCLLERALAPSGMRVTPQAASGSVLWEPEARRPFAYVRPDFIVAGPTGLYRLPVDAKYKDYGRRRLDVGDVYQVAIYAATLARTPNAGPRPGILLFPTSDEAGGSASQRVRVRAPEGDVAEVVAMGIPIQNILSGGDVPADVLEVVAQGIGMG